MHETAAAVIVAAGSSRRMGRDKLWLPLAGRIILARTVELFQSSPLIDTIVLVTGLERQEMVRELCVREQWQKVTSIVPGGSRRQDSVRAGLDELARVSPACRWVMIHDAARPLATNALLERGLLAAQEHGAAIAAVPVKDTIKQVEQGWITTTLDRTQLWTIQTPQVFAFPLIYQAHHSPLAAEEATDDAILLERLSHHVAIFPGSYTNIKITTEEDLLIARALLQASSQSQMEAI